jgi:hypothetical protein
MSIQAGDKIAHVRGGAGLVALGVRAVDTGAPLLLSCAHVLAPRDGMFAGPVDGNIIEAPPILDSDSLSNRIGTLKEFVTFEPDHNTIDAATCTPDPGLDLPIGVVSGHLVTDVWDPTVPGTQIAGRKVWRIDSQGDMIEGEILFVDSQLVTLSDGEGKVRFSSILRYRAPNSAGDSGGAVVDALTNQLVGLHFA